jgi:hypothetical protein
VGRFQYKGETGTWTEWHAMFDDGSVGTLAEDNGSYVFTSPFTLQRPVPPSAQLRVGATTAIDGKTFQVASSDLVALISAQGELPKLPPLGEHFAMVELRSDDGEVVSVDYGGQPPQLSRGRAVLLEDLKFQGLGEDADKTEGARQFSCPNCGASVPVVLDSTKSVTCPSCNSLIDMSQGIGGELRHALQDEPVQPTIPLGTTGQLQGVHWQVVGFQHRTGHEPGDDEEFGWNEYLLFNRKRGFIFLVDSEEGWSVVKPTTGAPSLAPGERSATYLGTKYDLKYSYEAQTGYVAGEFYWPVERGQKTFNRDFAKGKSLLSMEKTPREVTWSSGSMIDSESVAKAFKLESRKEMFERADATPVSKSRGMGCVTIIILFFIIMVLLAVVRACVDDEGGRGSGVSSGSRSSGGSFGGSSGGGGHK